MKPVYVIVDDSERIEFEKKWQIPYGYGACPGPFNDPKEAIEMLHEIAENLLDSEDVNNFIIEKITSGEKELYYRI